MCLQFKLMFPITCGEHQNIHILCSQTFRFSDFFICVYFQNPSYYGLEIEDGQCENTSNIFLSNIVEKAIRTLQEASCVVMLDVRYNLHLHHIILA